VVTQAAPGQPPQTQQRVRQFVWNNWGQLLKWTDENNVVTRYSYFPVSDPTGEGGSTPVSGVDVPGGYIARIEQDVLDPQLQRAAHLAPVRTVTTDFLYDQYGNRTRIEDGRNGRLTFEYNELGERIRFVGAEGELTQHRYDASGQLKETLREIRDLGFPSDYQTQVTRTVRDAFEYERDGLLAKVIIDADGLKITQRFEYDGNGNLHLEHLPKASQAVGAEPENRIRYEYDEADRRIMETQGDGSPQAITREFRYDQNGDLEQIIYASGRIQLYIRDGFGRLISSGDLLGNSYQTQLDDAGNIARVVVQGSIDGNPAHLGILSDTCYYYDQGDRLVALRQKAFTFEPGAGGQLIETPIGNGQRITRWLHDAAGNELKRFEPTGLEVTYTPDGHGLPAITADNQGFQVDVTYDAASNPSRVATTDPLGTSMLTQQHDRSGRLTSESDYRGTVHRAYFDTEGRQRLVEDALGNRVELVYDNAGRHERSIFSLYENGRRVNADGSVNVQIDTLIARTVHDANGNVTEVRDFDDNAVETFEYYATNQLKKRTLPDDRMIIGGVVEDPNPGEEAYRFFYRNDALVDYVIDPDGRIIRHLYDSAGRPTGFRVEQGTASQISGTTEVDYVIDGLGRIVEARDNNGETGRGAVIQRRYTSFGTVAWERQTEDFTGTARAFEIAAGYLSHGQRTLLRYPGGAPAIRAVPDVHGNTDFVVDNISGFRYADFGYQGRAFSLRRYPNGVAYGYGYDANKEVLEIRSFTGTDFTDDANMIEGHRFVYDEKGLQVRNQDLKEGRFSRISYDSLARLDADIDGYQLSDPGALPTSANYRGYDARGNLVATDAGAVTGRSDGRLLLALQVITNSFYNQADQLQQRSVVDLTDPSAPIIRSQRFQYDRRGNVRQDDDNDYEYDFRNRVVAIVSRSTGQRKRLHYDALGRRIRGADVRFAWWGFDTILEVPDSNAWYKRYIYGAKPGELLAFETNLHGTDVRYFIHDSRGSTIDFLTDAAGAIVERYGYDPFGVVKYLDTAGNELAAAARTGNNFLLHGHEYLPELGLYAAGPRLYHPFLGRFLQRECAVDDPLAYRNPYVYAANNPLAFTEDGHLAWWVIPLALYVAAGTAIALIETGIEAGIASALDDDDFNPFSAYLRNLTIGLATNWIPGAAAARPATRLAVRVGAHAARSVAATALEVGIVYGIERGIYGRDVSALNLALGVAAGNLAGDAVGAALVVPVEALRRRLEFWRLGKALEAVTRHQRGTEEELVRAGLKRPAVRALQRRERSQVKLDFVLRERARRLGIPRKRLVIDNDLPRPHTGTDFGVTMNGTIYIDRKIWLVARSHAQTIDSGLAEPSVFRDLYPTPGSILHHEAGHLLLDGVDAPGPQNASLLAQETFRRWGIISEAATRVLQRSIPT
jgi:RHS repeat-associated protein